ncbi:MAG: GNAT family N-acetyltransferase [Akkermansiaceae bacterium]
MPHTSVILRPQTDNDQTYLFNLFTETHTKKLQLNTLPADIIETLLKQQFRAQTTGYLSTFPDAQFLMIEQNNQAIGRLVISENRDTTHIIDIAISEENQGQAIGSNLIKSIIKKASTNQKSVTLDVDEFTGPVALYKKLGFKAININAGSITMQHSASA